MSALLQTHDLKVFYGDFQALFGVDVTVHEGETVAIIGSNGAGKSSFLNALTGLNPAGREQIVLEGTPVGGTPAYEMVKKGVALVPEGRKLFSSLSVEENLLIGLNGKSVDRGWDLAGIYGLFPILKERRNQPATTLSGGQQQQVSIGRALMSNPKMLLCDEISLGLAPTIVKDVYKAIKQIKARETTVLIVEQDLSAALDAADRIYCFMEGKVSLEGRPGDLSKEQIQNAYFGV